MAATHPVNHDATGYSGERMVEAHRFFSEQAREWLGLNEENGVHARAVAIETVARELLQMVIIDLGADENAQEIFETLNARGAQLTAADLIKNFVFQRLLEAGANVENIYEKCWKDFESGFWETEISLGRFRYPRSSIFLNHFLISRTGEEIVAREVFHRFKSFADHEASLPMEEMLVQISRLSQIYRGFVSAAETKAGNIDRLGLFVYRTGVLESEVFKPLLLWLLDPDEASISPDQFNKSLDAIESWMVRRMLIRSTTKNYNKIVAELVTLLRQSDRKVAGDIIETNLREQTADSSYWPDDTEIRRELETLIAYRGLRRGRLRMVLEAIEDHLRGFKGERQGLGDERVVRGKYHIEHVMPRKWANNWPLNNGIREEERDGLIDSIGNLTLLTNKLNTKVSNGPWLGINGKRSGLEDHDVLMLNREIVKSAPNQWTEESIRSRTSALSEIIISIWPVPAGHRSPYIPLKRRHRKKIRILDLIAAGVLQPGITLVPRSKKFSDRRATLLPDGTIEVDGKTYTSPSDAASKMVGHQINGWWFFLVDPVSRRPLRQVRRDYIDQLTIDTDDDETDDDEVDGEE